MLTHNFAPIYDANSKVLILGTFPSVKSRDVGFYYGHPKNRFWSVLAFLLNRDIPQTSQDKKELLLTNHIALYDVCAACDISSSSDATIKNVKPSNLDPIMANNIKAIFFNGQKAWELYQKFFKDRYDVDLIILPSTSPANAIKSFDDLVTDYHQILKYLR